MKQINTKTILISVLAILFLIGIGSYNSLVNNREDVRGQWSQVENQYKRRADLIPNLVETVKGYAKHESETFEAVVNARAQATQIKIDPANLTPEKLQEYQQAQGAVGAALSRLIALNENYPDLKANQNFLQLQNQLEETENRISVERTRFIDEAKKYDKKIKNIPFNILASLFGFEEIPYFEAEEAAKKVPEVSFTK